MNIIKQKGSLSDRAYEEIKKAITMMKIKPGDSLIEEELANRLGISRTPVRVALQKLSYEGLIEIQTRGYVVTRLSLNQFINLCVVRESIEVLSIQQACLNRDDNDIKLLKKNIQKQLALNIKTETDEFNFLELDRALHLYIAESTKNEFIVKMIHRTHEYYKRYVYFTSFINRVNIVLNDHVEIVKMIEKRDLNKAGLVMKNHLKGIEDSIIKKIASFETLNG